jgi:hypothetical protein
LKEVAMSEFYKQVDLACGQRRLVCWLPSGKERLRSGMQITIDGDETLWTITKVYELAVEHDKLYKTWKVGGLT